MKLIVLLIILLVNLACIKCLPLFFRGRPLTKHGMLGIPQSSATYRLNDVEMPSEQWFEQRLDHFDPTNMQTWKQRYFVNDTFYKTGGPVFLQLGGEGAASAVWVVDGQIAANYAPKFNAMSVLLEHRYYGASHPTANLSVDNLRYLTSEQALADAAYFVQYLTDKLKLDDSRWIVFGGSYSGSLAAWFRLKYPHLVSGAIASSAPLLAIVDFKEYLAVVRDSLGAACDDAINDATNELTQLLEHQIGWSVIQEKFKLCDQFDGRVLNDVYNLMSSLASNIEGVVQYNKDNRDFEGASGTNITIDVVCGVMTNKSIGSAYERYASVNSLILNAYEQKCVDFKYEKFIDEMSLINWNDSASEGGRQWTYQTCTEFGFFQSTDLSNQPFGNYFPVNFFVQQCVDIFGTKFDSDFLAKAVQFTNTYYGALNRDIRKVIFPNGSIDPWHALGVTRDLNPEAIALYINGTAHCADMYPTSDSDPASLTNARQSIVNSLSQFLQ